MLEHDYKAFKNLILNKKWCDIIKPYFHFHFSLEQSQPDKLQCAKMDVVDCKNKIEIKKCFEKDGMQYPDYFCGGNGKDTGEVSPYCY